MKKTLSLLLLLASLHVYAQKVQLKLDLKKDSTYYLNSEADLDIDEFINNNHVLVKTIIGGETMHKVTGIQDTVYSMEVAYKSIHMSMQAGEKTMEFRSDGDTTSIFSKMFSRLVNKPFYMTMSKFGRILEIKGLDNVLTSMVNGIPNLPADRKEQVMAQMRQSLSESSMKSQLQDSFIIFPEKSVEQHGTWVNENVLTAAAASVKTQTTYTLDTISTDSYDIAGNAKLIPANNAPGYKRIGQVYLRLVDVGGTSTTNLKMDKATGWILSSKVIKHIKSTAEVKQAVDGPVIMNFPMTIDSYIESTGH